MKEKIHELLSKELKIDHIEIIDDSAKHAGHAGAIESGGGHFTLKIKSSEFNGKSRVACHKMIYKALNQEIPHNIHALAIEIID